MSTAVSAPTSRTGRLRGVGTLARGLALGSAIVLGVTLATVVATEWLSASPAIVILGVIFALSLAFTVRSAFLGVWLKPDHLVVRTWFRTVKLPKADVGRCAADPYLGAWGVSDFLRELRIGRRSWPDLAVGGSMAWPRKSRRQARAINDWTA